MSSKEGSTSPNTSSDEVQHDSPIVRRPKLIRKEELYTREMHWPMQTPKVPMTSASTDEYFERPTRSKRGRTETRCEPQSPYDGDEDDKMGIDEAHLRPARPSPARVHFDIDEHDGRPMLSPGRDEMATRGRSNVRGSSMVRSQRPHLGRAVLYHYRGPVVV